MQSSIFDSHFGVCHFRARNSGLDDLSSLFICIYLSLSNLCTAASSCFAPTPIFPNRAELREVHTEFSRAEERHINLAEESRRQHEVSA